MTHSTAKKPSLRDSRLDVARGVAIAGVVIVHVYRGLTGSGIVSANATNIANEIFGLWALAVFAFVGGTLVPRGVRSRGVAHYVRDRVARFFIVYVIWTVLQGGVQLLAAGAVNTPMSPWALLTLWRPIGHLWYLPFLILVTVIFVPTQPWRPRRGPAIFAVAVVISAVFWGYDGGYVGTQGLGLVAFFVGGMVVGNERVTRVLDRIPPAVAAVAGLAVLVAGSLTAVVLAVTPSTFAVDPRTPASVAAGLGVAMVTSAALLVVGHGFRSVAFLATMGRRSLDIYLAHVILASGTRIVLVHLGVDAVWIYVIAGVLVGIVGSLVMGSFARRIKLGWVFDGPAWISRIAGPVSRPSASPERA